MSARGKMNLFRLVNISQALLWGFILFLTVPLGGNATAQICVPPPAGLVSWWPGDGDTADVADSNSGILRGGAAFAPGIVGQAFSFNGSDASVEVPYNANLNIQNEITIDAWVMKTGACKNNCIVILKQDDLLCCSSYRYGLLIFGVPGVSPGRAAFSFNTGGWEDVVISNTVLQDNVWYHLAGTYDGQTAKIYVNGFLDNAVLKSGSILPSTQGPLFIGRDEGGFGDDERFEGLIDELEISRHALSAQEIAAIFNAGSAGKCKAPSLISNGGFEMGPNPGRAITLPAGSRAITNWVVTSGTVDYIESYWTAAEGQRSLDLNGIDSGAISQTFKTKPGTTYTVRFAMAGNPDGPPTTKWLRVSADGESAELTFNTEGHSDQDMGYERRTVLFTAANPQTTLAFTSLIPGVYGPAIDDVTVKETALGNIDNLVHFTPESRSYQTTADATGCPSEFVGKFSFTATLEAKPTSPPLSDLVVKVAQLSNGNLLQNADGGPSGVGGLLTIPGNLDPSYQDRILTQGEKIQQIPFNICLTSKASFTFLVDVLGKTSK